MMQHSDFSRPEVDYEALAVLMVIVLIMYVIGLAVWAVARALKRRARRGEPIGRDATGPR